MKKALIIILSVLAALALVLMCSEAPDGGPSWVNFAAMGGLALICRWLEKLGAFKWNR